MQAESVIYPRKARHALGLVRVDAGLVSTRALFDHTDCGALLHRGHDDTPRFGTIGVGD